MALTPEQQDLLNALQGLHHALRDETFGRFKRINPFYEDIVDWHERGDFWTGDGSGVTVYGSTTIVGDVTIGAGTWVGPFCSLDGTGGLRIGKHCSISLGTQLLSHDTVRWALSGGTEPYEYGPIQIGDCCFVGTYAVITKGVTVGDHCVVAAGAVVTSDVPTHSIIAGVPARRIGHVEIAEDGKISLVHERQSGPAPG